MLRTQSELAPDAASVHLGMESRQIRPRVDHLDLPGRHAGLDESALDRLAHRDHGGDPRRGVAEAIPAVEGKTDPSIEDEHRDPDEEAGEHGETTGPAL